MPSFLKMNKKIILFLVLLAPCNSYAETVRMCDEILIDDVTDMAFGDRGKPYSGVVECFYDKENSMKRYERSFIDGIPVGTHYCYARDGDPLYAIQYKNGKKHKLGVYSRARKSWGFLHCISEHNPKNLCEDEHHRTCF